MPFTIERNDLARMDVDAVVVAANEELQITGGVGLTVALAADFEQMQEACNEIGTCPTGSAVATPGFNLPAQFVIHAVGPVWQGGSHDEAELLSSTYTAALELASELDAQSIALPLISAGTYGFPPDLALSIAREAVRSFLNDHEADVRLVLFGREALRAGLATYDDIAEYIDDHYVEEHPPRVSAFQPLPDELADYDWQQPQYPPAGGGAPATSPAPSGRLAATPPTGPAPQYAAAPPAGAAPQYAAPPVGSAPHYAAEPAERKKPGVFSRIGDALSSIARQREKHEEEIENASYSAAMPAPYPEEATLGHTGEMAPLALDLEAAGSTSFDLESLLDNLDEPFSTTLLALIDARGMTDVEVYKRANMSRQLFSRIRSDAAYRPTKKTALALAIALRLNLEETGDLLKRAGYALSNSNKADVIVEYCIASGVYDIFKVNEALYAFDQPIL